MIADICAVCNEKIGWLDVCYPQSEITVHSKCVSIFESNPEKFSGQSNEDSNLESFDTGEVQKWEKALPVTSKKQRDSLTTFMVKKSGEAIKEGAIKGIVFAKNATRTTKGILAEADRRVGRVEDIRTEEDAYEFAAKEIEEETYKKGLWAKAFSDADGDEKRQPALYIKYRAEQLIEFLEEIQ